MKFKSTLYRIIERFLAKYTDKIICISEAEVKSALDNHIVTHEKIELIPNGIDIDAVTKAIPKKRSDLQIPDNALVIGMIGRISPQKSPDVFVRAAKLIMDFIPNSYYIIVGSGELESEIKHYAENNHIPLLITGWTDEPYKYLKLFDIAVLLSRWEGFGLAIAEYMAAEKSIIATRIDAIPTIIEDGIDGLLVNADNPEEVANKVKWLVDHPYEASQMKQNAKLKVKKYFDVNRVVRQHLELFRQLTNEK